MTAKGKENTEKGCCQKFQDVVFGNMEKFFNKLGYKVAKHPFIAILISISIAGLLMVGFVRWRDETDLNELWIPSNSELYQMASIFEVHVGFPCTGADFSYFPSIPDLKYH